MLVDAKDRLEGMVIDLQKKCSKIKMKSWTKLCYKCSSHDDRHLAREQ